MVENGVEVEFSPTLGADHLMDALSDLGFHESSGFGPKPVSWGELLAFGQATSQVSEPWEFRALAKMSRAYCAGLRLGESVFAKFPWHEEDD